MRALVREAGGGTLRLVTDRPEPALAPGDALIKPNKLLIGPADLATGFSGVIGHQFVGVVKKVNVPADAGRGGTRKDWVGKRVVASPTIACAQCDLCRAGLSAHCRTRRVIGVHERDGCFADLFTMPVMNLCAVPDGVSDEAAVFAFVAAGAMHAVTMLRGGASEGRTFVTVLGDSALALLSAQALARKNATVRLLSSRSDRARLCERWGLKQRAIEEPGRRQDQDVVVDCTGSSAGLRLAMQFVRPRGTILLKNPLALAPYPPGKPFPETAADSPWHAGVDLTPAVVNEIQMIGSRDGPVAEALSAIQQGVLDVVSLITKRAKLDDALAAMSLAAHPDQLAVVLDV